MAKRFKRFLAKQISWVMNKVMGSGLAQEENTADGEHYVTPGMPEQIRKLAQEGIVLLKNENHVLPIQKEQTVSVFGRIQHDWFYVGYGSGGDVHAPYEVPFFQGLEQAGVQYNRELRKIYDAWCETPDHEAEHGYWGHWPYFQEEMPLTREIVTQAEKESDLAMIIIGRAAGEDRENKLEAGSYYLTETEREMLKLVTETFRRTVLIMDCGNIIDLAFLQEYRIDAIVYAWQLGQENGNALANILSGKVTPSGKLPDTIAKQYEDYPSSANFGNKEYNNYTEDIYVGYRYFSTFAPDRVLFPFGYGLSYTTFSCSCEEAAEDHGTFCFRICVTNTGNAAGKETVQIYVEAPNGKLGKAKRSLAGFRKTGLLEPGESETITIRVAPNDIASFDDSGITGYPNSFVLEAGTYLFHMGTDCTAQNAVLVWELEENRQIVQCRETMIPGQNAGLVLNPLGTEQVKVSVNGPMYPAIRAAAGSRDLRKRILEELPEEIPYTGDRGILLSDVKEGRATLETFLAQLDDEDLVNLTRGEGYMGSPLGTAGNAGAFGGITRSLRDKGIRAVITADGPAGLRVRRFATLLPCGTAIASTWNPELVEETFVMIGEEAAHFAIDVNLAPGMNIHRNPLCGRNFEYYAEDPMLSGRTAAATVRGLQAGGTSACPKHFACNNQEYNRNHNDSRVSMRALREIYLKNFEYCVKEGRPQNIMTSYNKVNGVWSHYNYDLATTILREEWGYEGNVMTDWWMRMAEMPEFPNIKNNAYRTRAQVDVLMPGSLGYTEMKYKLDKAHLKS